MKTRKELREEYKGMKFTMGVFQIRNIMNGKIFIGSSTDLKAVWHAQKFKLNAGMHPNSQLQKDWKEFGAENFVYEILDEYFPKEENRAIDEKEIKTLELLLIEELQPFDEKGYHTKKVDFKGKLSLLISCCMF